MWPRNPKFDSLYRGFLYNGVCYIGFLPIQITDFCKFAGPKILRYNRGFVISGFH